MDARPDSPLFLVTERQRKIKTVSAETSSKLLKLAVPRGEEGCNPHLGGTARFESDCIRNGGALLCRKKCLTLLKNKRRKYHQSFGGILSVSNGILYKCMNIHA